MDDQDKDYLRGCLKAGLLVWVIGGQDTWRLIRRIYTANDGTVVGMFDMERLWVDLGAIDIEEVMVTSDCMAKWPSQGSSVRSERLRRQDIP